MRRFKPKSRYRPSEPPVASTTPASNQEYRVGPGRPPKEFQFRPGQSGNPQGARRKTSSIAPDLKALLERALRKKVKLRQGEKEKIITMAEAGMEQLVNQYAKGDRYARRDLIDLAHKLGVDLVAGQNKTIEQVLHANVTAADEELIADFLRRHGGKLDNLGGDTGPDLAEEPPPDEPNPEPGSTNRKKRST
jgi:Family of unknown function (DUF5681)